MVAGLLGGWAEFGWVEKRDWVKNCEPPKGWPRPHDYKPLTYQNTVSTRTGCIYILGSNDRPGLVNSLSITGHVGIDEARFINAERMKQDLFPAIRGNGKPWPNNPHFKSMTISTDQAFIGEDADWVDDYLPQMDHDQIYLIAAFSLKVESVKRRLLDYKKLLSNTAEWDTRNEIKSKILNVEKELDGKQRILDRIRMNSVYFDTGSVLGNLAVLGEEYATVNANPLNLSPHIFRTSFLGIKPDETEQKFYPNFKKSHIIEGRFSSLVDEMGIGDFEISSIHIEDCNPDMELDIEIDFGDMCTCTVSQTHGREERYIKSFEVLSPQDEIDLIAKVDQFFCHHRHRVINLYKDPSGNSMENKKRSNTFGASVTEALRERGWHVIDKTPPGSFNPPHNDKYKLVAAILKEENPRYPVVRIIRHTNENLISSIKRAPRKVNFDVNGFRYITKDKSSEKEVPLIKKPALTTDHSDHFDIKLWHKYNHLMPQIDSNSWYDF